MTLKQLTKASALRFSRTLLSLYFEKRDMAALTRYMTARTSWIGTGGDELCRSLGEAGAALSAELEEYGGVFTLADVHLSFLPLDGVGGIVYGTLCATPDEPALSEERLRISAVLEQTEDGPRLLHIHFSHADAAQEPGDHFVKQNAHIDSQSLRAKLNARERQLANLTKNIPGGAHQCAVDSSLTLLSMSDGFLSMFGYTKEDIETQFDGKFINMVYPADRAEMMKTTFAQLEHGPDLELEYRVVRKEGRPVWVLDKGRLIEDGNGGAAFYCLLIDITVRKHQQEELRLSLERHQVILNQATDIIFEWDILRDTLSFSSNWKKRFGYEAIDQSISQRIPHSENIHPEDIPLFSKLMEDSAAGVPYSETEFRIRNANGRYCWCRIRATVQYDGDSHPIKVVGVIVDIDTEKRQKQALIQQAQFDTLTGIYNKATFTALMERRMQVPLPLGCAAPEYHVLMMVDVDYFKSVNDHYGHLCGDAVLSNVAAALKASVRNGDLVGRIGGDEFLVYLPEMSDVKSVSRKAEVILQALSRIQPTPGAPAITCSIGLAMLPRSQTDFQTLYQAADSALYQRKNNGRNGFSFYRSGEGEPPIEVHGFKGVREDGPRREGRKSAEAF